MTHNAYKRDVVPIEVQDSSTNLANFLSRRFLVSDFSVLNNTPYSSDFDPWDAFWSVTDIDEKLGKIGRIKHGLELTFVVNTNMASYGRLVFAYVPAQAYYDTIDHTTLSNAASFNTFYGFPYVELDLHGHCECSLVLPPAYVRRTLNIRELPGNGGLGRIFVRQPAVLENSLGNIGPLRITVYANAVDMEYDTPTQVNPIVNFTGEVAMGTSKQSQKIKRVVKKVLNRADTALDVAQTVAGVMAILAGLCRRQKDDYPDAMFPYAYPDTALSDATDVGYKLALQPANCLGMSPQKLSLPPDDMMMIESVLDHQMLFGLGLWQTSDAVGDLLFNLPVTPMQYSTNTSVIYGTRASHIGVMFAHWRGTLSFTFNVVCSGLHRGILVFKFDPYGGIASGNDDLHTSYVFRMDLSETRSITIDAPWVKTTSWCNIQGYSPTTNTLSAVRYPVTPTGGDELYNNGYITCQVFAPLITTNDDTASSVSILCKVNAKNVEFANPVPLPLFTWEPIVAPAEAAPVPDEGKENPVDEFIGEVNEDLEGDTQCDINEGETLVAGPDPDSLDTTNIDYMGEKIMSLKTLFSRYNKYETIPVSLRSAEITTPVFPTMPGYLTNAIGETTPGNDAYSYVNLTTLAWMSKMYTFWSGSIRYYVDLTSEVENTSGMKFDRFNVARAPIRAGGRSGALTPLSGIKTISTVGPYTWAGVSDEIKFSTEFPAGAVRGDTTKPIPVSFPFYTNYLAVPCPISDTYAGNAHCYKKRIMLDDSVGDRVVRTYVAAGEDFSFFFPIGPPPVRAFTYPA